MCFVWKILIQWNFFRSHALELLIVEIEMNLCSVQSSLGFKLENRRSLVSKRCWHDSYGFSFELHLVILVAIIYSVLILKC